jgi:hypothetical protein
MGQFGLSLETIENGHDEISFGGQREPPPINMDRPEGNRQRGRGTWGRVRGGEAPSPPLHTHSPQNHFLFICISLPSPPVHHGGVVLINPDAPPGRVFLIALQRGSIEGRDMDR